MKWLQEVLIAILVLFGCIVLMGTVVFAVTEAVKTPYGPQIVASLILASMALNYAQKEGLVKYYQFVRKLTRKIIIYERVSTLGLKYERFLISLLFPIKNTALAALFGRGLRLKDNEFLDKSQVENTS